MLLETDIRSLPALCAQLRVSILDVHRHAGAGHLGSSLSIVEILTLIFTEHFRWREPEEEAWRGDRFVLSKGHAALGLYCMLALLGRIKTECLMSFSRNGSPLEPHPNERFEPSIHASTGSLGQGLSIGVGLALGSRLRGALHDRTFVIIGDGEVNEGQIWEAARSATTLGLDNLIVVLDDNRMQQDGPTPDIMPVDDAVTCWQAMGWHCMESDGHDCRELQSKLAELLASPAHAPKLLRIQTIKGKGVDFLEGRTESHFPPPLSSDDFALAKYLIEREAARG
jgi:transketolase